jgi:ubiquinone/menaquinone biosynthesis C-methylase UbiE
MENVTFDPAEWKAQQRQSWDAVAAAWGKWWSIFEASAQSVSDRLVELAAIRPGHRVIDLATGVGEPAITAARRVGAQGRVLATDLAPNMLAVARRRAAGLEIHNLDFRIMDAEAPDGDLFERPFDAALCRWALMFFPDPAAGVRRLARLLVPGGRMAAAVWGRRAEVPIIGLRLDLASRFLGIPLSPPGAPDTFRLGEPGAVEDVFREAGLADVEGVRMTAVFEFESLATFARFQRDVAGPRLLPLAQQPPAVQERFWQEMAAAARPFAEPGGTVRLPNVTYCVAGRRPE